MSNWEEQEVELAPQEAVPVTRRTLLRSAVVGGVGTVVAGGLGAAVGVVRSERRHAGLLAGPNPVPGGTLSPLSITKYVTELPRLGMLPRSGTVNFGGSPVDQYTVASRQFTQQILPASLPRTTVWGYGVPGVSSSFRTPALTIEATVGRPVRATWINGLTDSSGNYLPHLFTVDPTLHWANPPGGTSGRDSTTIFSSTPPPYTGPVPLVTHLHGAHVTEESDGYPEAWTLPAAGNIPAGYASTGTYYTKYLEEAGDRFGITWAPGSSTYQYSNDQRATALWFHDHVLGMTRVNVQTGLAGMYLLRGGAYDLPSGVLPSGNREFAMVIQDRSFNTDGSLFFPSSRGFFGDVPVDGPWIPQTDVPPYWNPEFFANTIVVNGATWPVWHVQKARYRLRVLDACNARTLLLKVVSNPLASRPASAALPLWQIGADGGLLPHPVQLDEVIVAPAERADLILDFSAVPSGTTLYLINEGPDEPYHGGTIGVDFDAADPYTSGQVMKIVVGGSASDSSLPPSSLTLPAAPVLAAPTQTYTISLNENDSGVFGGAPIFGALGTVNPDGTGYPLMWDDAVNITPQSGTVSEWALVNLTEDGHPIHIHQTQFQVLSRTAANGAVRGPQSWETGPKDTVIALPGETTRLRAYFDIPGRYVFHCHIIDHEDNEMMRPFQVT